MSSKDYIAGLEEGRFQGTTDTRLAEHDAAIGDLKEHMSRVEDALTDIKALLGKQNGVRSYARTGGIGIGGAGAAWVVLETVARLLGGG